MLKEFFEKYLIDEEVIAVGVSGGADSLALVLQLNAFLRPQGRQVIALTVDHGLRKESAFEAQYVADLMAKHQIEHHILVWTGEKPQTGIEEAARTARYALLCDWCKAHNIKTLAVAHHLLDQAETFLMRLQRGSGLNGLCGMSAVSEKNDIRLIRPFLSMHPDKLKDYLRAQNISWMEDASNACDDYLRVRVRKFLPKLAEALDITPERIVDTMEVLAHSKDYLEAQTDKFVNKNVRWFGLKGAVVSRQQLALQHEEIVFRVLCLLLKKIGLRDYIPRADDVLRLQKRIFDEAFHGATLAGCEIVSFRQKLWIVPELKNEVKLSKKDWENFVLAHPEYAKIALPHKLKLSLYKSS